MSPMKHTAPDLGRRLVASLWAALAGPWLVLALWVPLARALGVFERVSVTVIVALGVVAAPLAVALAPRLAAPLPESLDRWFEREKRARVALWALGGLFAVFTFAKVAVFLGDPRLTAYSFAPGEPFLVHHSCLTAYVHGAILSKIPGANVYDMAFVQDDPGAPPPLPPTATSFAPFALDAFGYPPPFLLLPRAMLALTTNFYTLRLVFGAASLVMLLAACAATAFTLGGLAGRRMWLLTPMLLANPVVIITLQVGNFHLAAVALCLACWVALHRRRDGLAGALLAVATLAKIFPGLLGVLLLMHRRWRAAAFTVLAAAVVCALSVAVLGVGVWRDFVVYHLPHVDSGEALRFMARSTREIAFNVAPFGIPFKLQALGFAGWSWPQARLFGRLYTALVFALAVLASRNRGTPRHELTVWLAVVMLASLRSPYAAPFVLSTVCVLLAALVAEVRAWRGVAAIASVWALITVPTPSADPSILVGVSLVRVLVFDAWLVWVALRRERPTSEAPDAFAGSPVTP
jgi:alpha-1,2-mannosyltransferase